MTKAEIKIKGIKQLQERLLKIKEEVRKRLQTELMQLGEEALIHAKENKGYHDRTANLKNSISFALYEDGKPVMTAINIANYRTKYKDNKGREHDNPFSEGEVKSQSEDNLTMFATKEGVVAPKGYTLIVVAGMNYGAAVESKGYNVLFLTSKWMQEKMLEILKEVMEEASGF